MICQLLKKIANSHPSNSLKEFAGRIGIISPYSAQIYKIKEEINRFSANLGLSEGDKNGIEINTVDAY